MAMGNLQDIFKEWRPIIEGLVSKLRKFYYSNFAMVNAEWPKFNSLIGKFNNHFIDLSLLINYGKYVDKWELNTVK